MTRCGPGARRPGLSLAAALACAAGLCSAPIGGARAEDAPAAPPEVRTESGPVSAVVRLRPAEPRIGDAIELELEVRAEPGVELLMPEFGEALDRFTIAEFAPSESLGPDGGTIAIQRYTLHPPRSGEQSVPPLLVEFIDRRPGRAPAPEGQDAYELLTERIDFEVSSSLPPDAPLELRAALGALPPRRTADTTVWIAAGAAVALLALATPFALRAWRAAQAARRRRSAYEVARTALDALLYGPRPDADHMDAFYVELSSIVRRYLEDHLGLRSPELTTEEFLEELAASPDLVRTHRSLLETFLRRADLVKFAHHLPEASDVEESIQGAQRIIEETRELAHA